MSVLSIFPWFDGVLAKWNKIRFFFKKKSESILRSHTRQNRVFSYIYRCDQESESSFSHFFLPRSFVPLCFIIFSCSCSVCLFYWLYCSLLYHDLFFVSFMLHFVFILVVVVVFVLVAYCLAPLFPCFIIAFFVSFFFFLGDLNVMMQQHQLVSQSVNQATNQSPVQSVWLII